MISEIDLISSVKQVKISGDTGLKFLGIGGILIIEIKAETTEIRDQWYIFIINLLEFDDLSYHSV